MKATQFTPEQDAALRSLESAIGDPDHGAIGHNRRWQAARVVVHHFKQVERLGVADALTPSEMFCVNRCRIHISP